MDVLQQPHQQEYRGYFTDVVINSPHLCTALDSTPCHIVAQLSVCNELLYHIQLELSECSLGQLGLGSVDYVKPEPESEHIIDQAFHLASCLLSNHHCIACLHLQPWDFYPKYEEMIRSSFRPTSALKSLKLAGNEWLVQAVVPATPYLNGLEELDCGRYTHPKEMIEPLCCLLAKSSALKKLALPFRNLKPPEASLFYAALSTNCTLSELWMMYSCIMPEGQNYSAAFATSLEKSPMLKSLTISWDGRERLVELKHIIDAVCLSKSVVNFSLHNFRIDTEALATIENLLTTNSILTSFRMISCYSNVQPGELYPYYFATDQIEVVSPRIRPWLAILQNNRTLQELRLNLKTFSSTDCRAFFAELQKNTSLKRVFLEDLYLYFHARGVLAYSESTQNKGLLPFDRPDILITQCEQLSNVSLVLIEERDVAWMKITLRALPSCSHVTKLRIHIFYARIGDTMEELIADYIKHTNTLQELGLGLPLLPLSATESACRTKLFEALRDNVSLRKLFVHVTWLTKEEAAVFSKILRSRSKIFDLRIRTSAKSTEYLLNCLCPGFSANYTLVSLWFDCIEPLPLTRNLYFAKDVVRRNRDLVARAARGATGSRSRSCAEALEVVARNPALIEKISELETVGEEDAEKIVRSALSDVIGLDNFMRVTGVVKRRVTCLGDETQKLQLDDLDEYSWRHVRRLLRLADVLPPASRSFP